MSTISQPSLKIQKLAAKYTKEHEFGCETCGCYNALTPKCPQCEDYGMAGEELEAHRATRGF